MEEEVVACVDMSREWRLKFENNSSVVKRKTTTTESIMGFEEVSFVRRFSDSNVAYWTTSVECIHEAGSGQAAFSAETS